MSNYIKELPDNAIQVKNAIGWVTPDGSLYGIETRTYRDKTKHRHYGEYFKYHTTTSTHNGYVYVPVKYYIDKDHRRTQLRQRRLHILVAEAFVENPNNYPIVGHRNNIKTDNRAANLYWTTVKENTQKAVDDGLMVNARGYEDSQSNPVIMYDTLTNEELDRFGSIREAAKAINWNATTISRQARYKRPVLKPVYFRFEDDPSTCHPAIVVQYDMETDNEVDRFVTRYEASRQTGISENTIWAQCKLGHKPQWSKSGTYFLYV